MNRLAVFRILSAKNVIDEVLTEGIIGVNTAKILEIDDFAKGTAIKIRTSPRHDGYIYVFENREQVFSHLGYQATKTLTFTRQNNRSLVVSTEDIYYAYIKKERTFISYWDGSRMTSASLKMTFVEFVTEFNNLGTSIITDFGSLRVGSDTAGVYLDNDIGIALFGDATVWDDMRVVPTVWDVSGQIDPDQIDYYPEAKGSPFRMYGFAKGDRGWFVKQIPHTYKEGSTLYAHIHWTPGPRGNEEAGHTVQWGLDYSIASINDYFPSSTTIVMEDTCDGVDDKHQMTPEITIPGDGLRISAEILGMIYRIDNGDTWVGTTPNLPLFIEIDFHYEINSLGSRTSSSK